MWEWICSWCKRIWDILVVSARTTEIVLRLFPLLLLTPMSTLSPRVSDWTWAYVTRAVQALGPAFVKFCQWVATRRDIFPPHVCDRLGTLHDRGTPHEWAFSQQALTEAFGDYEAKGLTIEDVVGCGSAAQVYRGTLTEGERVRPVAVKVLHPRFEQLVARDLWLMQTVAELLHSLPLEALRLLNLPRATQTFGSALQLQSDLRVEAQNLDTFRHNFASSAIFFPQPIWSSPMALVEDLVEDSVPITEYLKDEDAIEVRRALAGPLLRAFLKMVFLDNFVHADLHPGNVLVQTKMVTPEKSWWSQTEAEPELKRFIVFLDAGIATSLSPNDQRNLIDLFRAVITNSGYEAGRLMVERAKYERCTQVEGGTEAFAQGIAGIVSEFHDRRKEGLTLGAVRIGSLLSRVLDLCRVHGVEIDPAMASIVISTLVLEGLGRSLEPNLNLIDFAIPFVMGRGRV